MPIPSKPFAKIAAPASVVSQYQTAYTLIATACEKLVYRPFAPEDVAAQDFMVSLLEVGVRKLRKAVDAAKINQK